MSADPAVLAAFDQTRASASVEVTGLIGALHGAHDKCQCGGPLDAATHLMAFIEIFEAQYTPNRLATLLTEAVARLAVEGGAS